MQPAISSLIDPQHPERICTPVQLDSSFFFPFKFENSISLQVDIEWLGVLALLHVIRLAKKNSHKDL